MVSLLVKKIGAFLLHLHKRHVIQTTDLPHSGINKKPNMVLGLSVFCIWKQKKKASLHRSVHCSCKWKSNLKQLSDSHNICHTHTLGTILYKINKRTKKTAIFIDQTQLICCLHFFLLENFLQSLTCLDQKLTSTSFLCGIRSAKSQGS